MKMRRMIRSAGLAASAILSIFVLGDRTVACAEDGGTGLVTSGVDLLPILIGDAPADPAATFQAKTWDGHLNLVIDSPYQIWTAMGTYIHLAAWDPDFKPAAGARVFMDGKILGQMDVHGTLVFSIAPNVNTGYSNSHNLDVVYEKGSKSFHGSTYFNAYPRTQGFESASVFVYTDRGVYNPGQVVRVRAIAWKLLDDFKPLANAPIDLLLEDAWGRVVAGGAMETDEWGVTSFDIPLPEHAPEGNYKLKATYDRETADAKIRIERFVAPAIDIQHDLGRFLTRDTKTLPVKITLGMFGGGDFTKGKLSLDVVVKGESRFHAEREVSGKGPHEFVVDEASMKKIKEGLGEDETVRFTISVTDEYFRHDEIKRDLRFTSNPYRVVVEMDKDQYAPGDTVRAMVRVVDLDEAPITGKSVEIDVEGKKIGAKTDKTGIAKIEFPMGDHTIYGSVYMEGVDSPVATAYAYYYPPRPMTSEIPAGVVKESALTEIVVHFPSDYEPAEDVVHADIVDSSGALIGAVLVPVKKEAGKIVARGTFPAPTWGSMLLTLFCIGKQKSGGMVGLLTEGQNLPVAADRELEVTLKGLPEKAAPGETVSLQAIVRTKDGKKATASVGASIVDQAVIGMLDPLEITPMDKFYNPQLKVLSTTGSKILTWPVVSRNWGSPLYDIALPPFGFRSGGTNTEEQAIKAQKNYAANGGGFDGDKKKGKGGGKKAKASPKKAAKKPAAQFDYFMDGEGSGGGGSGYGYSYGSVSGSGALGGAEQVFSAPISYAKGAEDKSESIMAYPSSKEPGPKPDEPMDVVGALIGDGKDALSMGGGGSAGVKPAVKVVVRTNFAETSLWAPMLAAKDGQMSFAATLPDSITTQTVTLVASDKAGRVGMVREKVDVAQDLYARSDLPATLVLGDQVQVTAAVRNFTKKQVTANVGIKSESIEISGADKKEVTVPPGGTASAAFTVRPMKAGKVSYEVWAEGAGIKDVEKRDLYVAPASLPTTIEGKGKLKKDKPFKAKIHLSEDDLYHVVFLNVSFPGAVPVIQGIEAMADQTGGAIDFISSNALVTAMAYRYLLSYGENEDVMEKLRFRLQGSLASLLMSQNADGGWGWHVYLLRSGTGGEVGTIVPTSNPYMTAQSLEGLVEMKKAGLPVPETAVRDAVRSLTSSLGSDGLWSVDQIAFWEGQTNEVQMGVSAEIFRVMALAIEAYPAISGDPQAAAAMDSLSQKFDALISSPDARDPLALSHAAIGVWAWAKIKGSVSKDLQTKLQATALRLIQLRDEAYWEPSWFNAFGGTLEATAAAMELLSALDKDAFDAELRSCLKYILSTQESFGAWHNARGTAAAVRALLLAPPTVPEIASKVVIEVNGKQAAVVEIDPKDPYMSAIALRQMELTEFMKKGDNTIEITYDGNLDAPVTLAVDKWTGKQGAAASMPGAPDVEVSRKVVDLSDGAGMVFDVGVTVEFGDEGPEPIVVTEPLPANADVEVATLDALVAKGVISGYDLESDAIVFYVAPASGKVEIEYQMAGTRTGAALQPGTQVAPVADPSLVVMGKATKIRVK